MKKVFVSALTALLFSSHAQSAESSFLTAEEALSLNSYQASYGVVLSKSEWIALSDSPALVVGSFVKYGREILVVARDGEEAVLVDDDILEALQTRGFTPDKIEASPKGDYCTSSCWDDAIGKGLKEGGIGAAGGAAAGAAIGGSYGAGIGAGIGGAGGAIGGGIEGYNECQKNKAEICKEN